MDLVTGGMSVPIRDGGQPDGDAAREKMGASPSLKGQGAQAHRASRATGLSPAHRLLWEHLQVWARGRKYARTRKEICASLAGANSEGARAFVEIGERQFKQLTKDLLAAGFPAFSCEDGYYAGQDAADVADFRRYILKLARPTLRLGQLARWAMEDEAMRRRGLPVPVQRHFRGQA